MRNFFYEDICKTLSDYERSPYFLGVIQIRLHGGKGIYESILGISV